MGIITDYSGAANTGNENDRDRLRHAALIESRKSGLIRLLDELDAFKADPDTVIANRKQARTTAYIKLFDTYFSEKENPGRTKISTADFEARRREMSYYYRTEITLLDHAFKRFPVEYGLSASVLDDYDRYSATLSAIHKAEPEFTPSWSPPFKPGSAALAQQAEPPAETATLSSTFTTTAPGAQGEAAAPADGEAAPSGPSSEEPVRLTDISQFSGAHEYRHT